MSKILTNLTIIKKNYCGAENILREVLGNVERVSKVKKRIYYEKYWVTLRRVSKVKEISE